MFEKLLSMEPKALLEWLSKEFRAEMPEEVRTIEDMEIAGKLVVKLSGYFSFLNELLSYAKLDVRAKKRAGDKTAYEDAIDRREVIQGITDAVKQKYSGISRAVTIHQEINNELKLTGNFPQGRQYGNAYGTKQ